MEVLLFIAFEGFPKDAIVYHVVARLSLTKCRLHLLGPFCLQSTPCYYSHLRLLFSAFFIQVNHIFEYFCIAKCCLPVPSLMGTDIFQSYTFFKASLMECPQNLFLHAQKNQQQTGSKIIHGYACSNLIFKSTLKNCV